MLQFFLMKRHIMVYDVNESVLKLESATVFDI